MIVLIIIKFSAPPWTCSGLCTFASCSVIVNIACITACHLNFRWPIGEAVHIYWCFYQSLLLMQFLTTGRTTRLRRAKARLLTRHSRKFVNTYIWLPENGSGSQSLNVWRHSSPSECGTVDMKGLVEFAHTNRLQGPDSSTITPRV